MDIADPIGIADAQLANPVLAFMHDDVILEQVEEFQGCVLAMGDDILPMVHAGGGDRSFGQFVIVGVLVGDDKK